MPQGACTVMIARFSPIDHMDRGGDDFSLVMCKVECALITCCKFFHLRTEEIIGVRRKVMTFACFLMEREKVREIFHRIFRNPDSHSFAFRSSDQIASVFAHAREDICLRFSFQVQIFQYTNLAKFLRLNPIIFLSFHGI